MTRVLLVGGGHAHVEVLRRFALAPPRGAALTLVSPSPALTYSAMVPGVIAGHYALQDAEIDLALLAARAGARFASAAVTALDPVRRVATLAGGAAEAFDIASLDVGASSAGAITGAREHAIAVRPLSGLLAAWQRVCDDARSGVVRSVAVVGGGIAGVELACAMRYRLRADLGLRAPAVVLITDQAEAGAQQPPGVRRRLARLLAVRGIAVHTGRAVQAIDAHGVQFADEETLSAERVIVATPAMPAAWLRASGLACDAQGFVRVDATLHSVSHPAVLAAGDCASQDGAPRPRSGVYAVRAGPPLAENLRRAIAGDPPRSHHPQRRALALIAMGDRYAVASRPPWSAEGAWVWRWKDRIDRRFVARYRVDA